MSRPTRPGAVPSGRRITAALALGTAVLSGLAGCRSEMYDQPRYDTFQASAFFPDGLSARPLVAGTVPRGWARQDEHLYYGRVDGALASTFPFEIDRAVIERGQDRFMAFCSPCHGGLGDGNGMIVQRGLPKPPSFHEQRLRDIPVGHIYDVITRGYGAMYSYAHRIKPRDRWAVVAYIRALQLSQNAQVSGLPEADRERLEQPQEAAQ
ncbi:c-type cytochrome [Tautonia sociabilis]|uniref:Cytochrome c n=1 Tax=Tautonia sociabilis TaxID=2080755 RepID=A0A432MRJ2_9BACT|nr:cytochrome c [Tautonia sociabilis]RUL89575.1 cytochrome c [Tautonia sociabilis]